MKFKKYTLKNPILLKDLEKDSPIFSLNDMFVHDLETDTIVKLSNLKDIYIATTRNDIEEMAKLEGKIVMKGVYNEELKQGGELIPFVIPANFIEKWWDLIMYIMSEEGDIKEIMNSIQTRFDTKKRLEQGKNYQNPIIGFILESYQKEEKIVEEKGVDLEEKLKEALSEESEEKQRIINIIRPYIPATKAKAVARKDVASEIRKALATREIPVDKAFNIKTGILININPNHIIKEYTLTVGDIKKTVKIAFPPNQDTTAAENMLKEEFNAVLSESSKTDIAQRKAIALKPILTSEKGFLSTFGSTTECFNRYNSALSNIATIAQIDVSSLITTETATETAPEEEQEIEEEIEEF